jgi:hypothetical protein
MKAVPQSRDFVSLPAQAGFHFAQQKEIGDLIAEKRESTVQRKCFHPVNRKSEIDILQSTFCIRYSAIP